MRHGNESESGSCRRQKEDGASRIAQDGITRIIAMAKKQTKKGGKLVVFSTCPKCGRAIQRDHDCADEPTRSAILRAARSEQYRRMIVGHKILA
jgi:hypothetical protein